MSVRSLLFFALLLISLPMLNFKAAAATAFAQFPKQPFWEKKQKIYARMFDERAIYVAIKTEKRHSPQPGLTDELTLLGAGVVSSPRQRSYDRLIQFSRWSEIHEYIKASHWTAANNRLFLHLEAFKYHAKMIFQVSFRAIDNENWIHMKVVQGSFKGMRVALRLKDAKSRKTEIAIVGQYEFSKLPMPQFFVEFGLEVVFQKIAEKMRLFLEASEK